MITILAEKNDMARKIAAAIGDIKLDDGTIVTFSTLKTYEKAVKAIQAKKGFIPIKFMGQDCCVTHARGHLCTLWDTVDYDESYKNWKNLDLPYIPPFYGVKIAPNAFDQFKIVKSLFEKSSLIINATDADREGDLIFSYIYEKTKSTVPYKRAIYHSTTEDALEEAFSNLKDSSETQSTEDAGRCRAIADWLIGINCTVAATLTSGASSVISIGRVQTPTLAMVVDREKAINSFEVKTHFCPAAVFTTPSGETYTGESEIKCESELEAANVLSRLTGIGNVVEIEKKVESVPSPSLFSLSLLQMEANKRFGFTAEETLNITQSLYEQGYVTYPRTNSAFLPEDYMPTADKTLTALALIDEYSSFIIGRPKKYNEKYFNDKKVESHFAIVPTHATPEKLTDNERAIYDLVARSLIMTIYPSAKVEKVRVVTRDADVDFITKGSTILEKGWMEVGEPAKEKYVPTLLKGMQVSGEYETKEKKTEPPKRYTEASLLAAMLAADKDADESDYKSLAELGVKGIGTEATRASILELLVKRGYVERKKKSLFPTEKGILLIDNLPLEEIKSATLTAMWENRLHDVEFGKEKKSVFIKDIEELTRRWTNIICSEMKVSFSTSTPASESDLKCPLCGGTIRPTSFGYGCSNYKSGCKFTINKTICDKKLTPKQVESLLTKGRTSEIKGFVSKKTGKTFSAKLVLGSDGKITFEFAKK